ncbi:hypothetical protein [Arthrobacter sp. H20]|uniref:hypothetical protein n=1 Tax=Arthrobacter sp. H20 TaxID=1267981 RepID=UPI0004AE2411|nr:hypothetical protein [Arthrobacter sp. H20]
MQGTSGRYLGRRYSSTSRAPQRCGGGVFGDGHFAARCEEPEVGGDCFGSADINAEGVKDIVDQPASPPWREELVKAAESSSMST